MRLKASKFAKSYQRIIDDMKDAVEQFDVLMKEQNLNSIKPVINKDTNNTSNNTSVDNNSNNTSADSSK